jgi:hypothetical protein
MAIAADSGEMVDGAGGLPRKKGTPANTSNTPSSLLNTTAGRVNQPPTKAAGIESSRNGHSNFEEKWPALAQRTATTLETSRFKTRAVGLIVSGASPNSPITARKPEALALPTLP